MQVARAIGELKGHTREVSSVAFHPSGELLASGGLDGRVQVFNSRSHVKFFESKGLLSVWSVAFSPDGTLLAAAEEKGVKLWQVPGQVQQHSHWQQVAWPGRWRTALSSMAFSPSGHLLAVGGDNGSIELWRIPQMTLLGTLQIAGTRLMNYIVAALSFSPDERMLACASRRGIHLFDVQTSTCLWAIEPKPKLTTSVAFTPDGGGIAYGLKDGTLRLMDLDSRRDLLTFTADSRKPFGDLEFSSDGALLAAVCEDRTVRVWDVASQQQTITAHVLSSELNCLAFARDGRLATGGKDSNVRLWEMRAHGSADAQTDTSEPWRDVLPAPLARGWVPSTSEFWSDGKVVLTAANDRLLVYNRQGNIEVTELATRERMAAKSEKLKEVRACLSPDGSLLAMWRWSLDGPSESRIELWDTSSLRMRRAFDRPRLSWLAFHPRRTLLLCGHYDDVITIWDYNEQRSVGTLLGPQGVSYLAVSHEGIVCAAQKDGTVRVWDLESGRQMPTIHESAVKVALAAGGRVLATASNLEVTLWDTGTGQKLGRVEGDLQAARTRRILTRKGNRLLLTELGDPMSPRLGRTRSIVLGEDRLVHASLSADGDTLVTYERGRCQMIPLEDLVVQQGEQFVFVQSNLGQSTVRINGDKRQVEGAAIFSRHETDIEVPPKHIRVTRRPFFPLQLVTVMTDRRVYRPAETARIVFVAPGRDTVSWQAWWNGNKISEQTQPMPAEGMTLASLPQVREGGWEVRVWDEQSGRVLASTTFTVAEHALSLLEATITDFEIAGDDLQCEMQVTQLGVPFEGPLVLALRCEHCDQELQRQDNTASSGVVCGNFRLDHPGPFHVQVTTPQGETATVPLPGTEETARQTTRVGQMGQPVTVSAAPFPGATPQHGFFLASTIDAECPLHLHYVVGEEGVVTAREARDAVVVVVEPRSGAALQYTPGEDGTVRFPLPAGAPYALLHAAAWTPTGPYETFGVMVRPERPTLQLSAPAHARPGDTVAVGLRTSRPGPCLLLALDSRLEIEDPVSKLGAVMAEALREAARSSSHGVVTAHAGAIIPTGAAPARGGSCAVIKVDLLPTEKKSVGFNLPNPFAMLAKGEPDHAPLPPGAPGGVDSAQAARLDFPELLSCELLQLTDEATLNIKLGDAVGSYRILAFQLDETGLTRAEALVSTIVEPLVELDLPAVMGQDDEVEVNVRYHADTPCQLEIRTAAGITRERVAGRGLMSVPLRGAQEVVARIHREAAADEVSRVVAPSGRVRVVASELRRLQRNEVAEGWRVHTYPSTLELLGSSVEALTRYPFG